MSRLAQRGAYVAFGTALAARLAVVAWAGARFPPAADGVYFDTLARRLAHGAGYTWAWPDGAVTYAAHYPVGYPALVALGYLALGAKPWVAMLVNALFGAAMAAGAQVLARPAMGEGRATAAAIAVGLHPAMVPYVAAVMTEGVAAALVVLAAAVVVTSDTPRASRIDRRWIGAGVLLGVATLVRPQCVALAPVLGFLAPRGASLAVRLRAAVVVLACSVLVCLPWTARNAARMHDAALVSVNGGWNLLIGAQSTSGAWQPIQTPAECATVWDEAAKDACFKHVAVRTILDAPLAWLRLVPAKLAVTLDYFGAGPWYLHTANPSLFGDDAKWWLGAVETVASRIALVAALVVSALAPVPYRRARIALAAPALALAFTEHAWPAYLILAVLLLLRPRPDLARAPLLVGWTALVLLGTAATHAVFFGAGRYGLVVAPLVTLVAFLPIRGESGRASKVTPRPAEPQPRSPS